MSLVSAIDQRIDQETVDLLAEIRCRVFDIPYISLSIMRV